MAKSKDVLSQIKKATRRRFSADEKIRIVLEGLKGESTLTDRRREGIAASVYYKWSKSFLEAGKCGEVYNTRPAQIGDHKLG
jgi:transposase